MNIFTNTNIKIYSNINKETLKKLGLWKQFLVFLWFSGNECTTFRDVSDRFGITISSLHKIVKRVTEFSNMSAMCLQCLQYVCGCYKVANWRRKNLNWRAFQTERIFQHHWGYWWCTHQNRQTPRRSRFIPEQETLLFYSSKDLIL